jgi:hypothetical protein
MPQFFTLGLQLVAIPRGGAAGEALRTFRPVAASHPIARVGLLGGRRPLLARRKPREVNTEASYAAWPQEILALWAIAVVTFAPENRKSPGV